MSKEGSLCQQQQQGGSIIRSTFKGTKNKKLTEISHTSDHALMWFLLCFVSSKRAQQQQCRPYKTPFDVESQVTLIMRGTLKFPRIELEIRHAWLQPRLRVGIGGFKLSVVNPRQIVLAVAHTTTAVRPHVCVFCFSALFWRVCSYTTATCLCGGLFEVPAALATGHLTTNIPYHLQLRYF